MNWLLPITRRARAWWSSLSLRRRVAYLGLPAVALLLTLTTGKPASVAAGLWVAFNLIFLARVVFWALRHPTLLFRVRGTVLRWALGVALVLTLWSHAAIGLMLRWTNQSLPEGLFFFFWLLICLPVAGCFTLAISGLGAAFGGFLARRTEQQPLAARIGVIAAWLTILVIGLLARLLGVLDASPGWGGVLIGGFPTLGLWLGPIARHLEYEPLSQWLVRILQRGFVWRIPWRGVIHPWDLQATACAFAGFALAGALLSVGILSDLQASSLIWLIKQRHLLAHLGIDRPRHGLRETPRFALVEWDNRALRRALEETSEAAVQADLIRRATAAGALRVIVSPPTLGGDRSGFRGDDDKPPMDAAATARSRRGLPLLEAALREATNAVFCLPKKESEEAERALLQGIREVFGATVPNPPAAEDTPEMTSLRAAAHQVGSDRFVPFLSASLPAISLRPSPDGIPPLPLLLAGAVAGETGQPCVTPLGPRRVRLGQREMPLIAEDLVLVDVTTGFGSGALRRLPVSAVLEDQPIFAGAGTNGGWMPPSRFLREKIVFLEPLAPTRHATALGEQSRAELLAEATRTLLGELPLRRPAAWKNVAGALGCAWLVGLICAGCGLAAGSWRLLLLLVAIAAVSVLAFPAGLWIDPVFPVAAALCAFPFVTQLTLTLERLAKDQNRSILQRFVAPEVVESLLEKPETRLALGGRRERVAILFADVRGFSRFAEAHSPEEVISVVNAYLQVMTDALFQHGGLLDKYTGDGLMALFRVGDTGDAGVIQALHAALAMRDAALALSVNRLTGGDESLQVGIALHVGEAVVGLVGNATRQVNFTALGHAVVVAARLQTLAGAGEAIISDDVRFAVADAFDLEARDPVSLKGVSTPVRCYRVLGPRLSAPPRI